MAKILCPRCCKNVNSVDGKCDVCGETLSAQQSAFTRFSLIVLLAIGLFCVIGAIVRGASLQAEQRQDEAAHNRYLKEVKRFEEEKAKRDIAARFQTARSSLAQSTSATEEVRLKAYRAFIVALNDAISHEVPTGLETLKELMNALEISDRQLTDAEGVYSSSELKEKPTYEKPEYDGVFYLSGAYRGRYAGGGIIVQHGSHYFIVENADPAGTPFVSGYVERTGGMEILDIGDGRDADAVRLSDREAYEEDQKQYREQVADAKQQYQDALKSYESAHRARKQSRPNDEALVRLRSARDQQLRTLAQDLAELRPVALPFSK